jgi:hypothetical protein
MIGRRLSHVAAGGTLRAAARAFTWLVIAAIAVAATPVSVVAAAAMTAAGLFAWTPRRMLIAAAWCAPMVAVWLAWTAWATHGWVSVATAPYRAWLDFWHLVTAGAPLRAVVAAAPPAIPLGLAAGALALAYRTGAISSGAGGRSPASRVTLDRRQWRRQVRSAQARIAAPGTVPLTMRADRLVVGAVIRTIGHEAGPVAAISYQRMRSHLIVLGSPGTGKTTLFLRLWTAYMTIGIQRYNAGLGARPMLVVLDCKGAADSRAVADRFRRLMLAAGARVAIWPDEASLSLWQLPPHQLTTKLVDLIEHGEGAAAYYTDVMEALIALAVEAPCGPPRSASDLLARLEPGWLTAAYAGSGTAADHAVIGSASRQLADVALRFRTLFRRLGAGLDGPGSFSDADAWYCILEGTDQVRIAEAQARALVDLLTSFTVHGRERREIVLAVDEFSAVSRRLPLWDLCERARSLGLAVEVSAQSWEGLAATEDDRHRIVASAEGGIWLLRTPKPEPLAALAGTREVLDTTRSLARYPFWRRQGYSRVRDVPVVDRGIIRRLRAGQVAHIYEGGVTYIQVKRLVAAPAAADPLAQRPRARSGAPTSGMATGSSPPAGVAAGSSPPAGMATGSPAPARIGLPDVRRVLDAAFGPEPPVMSTKAKAGNT